MMLKGYHPLFVSCVIPQNVDHQHLMWIIGECIRVPRARLDELLALIPADQNQWTDEIDFAAFERAKAKGDQREMQLLEGDAKKFWLATLLSRLARKWLSPLADRDFSHPVHSLRYRTRLLSGPWEELIVSTDREDAWELLLLDSSHICRVNASVMWADDIATEIEKQGLEGRAVEYLDGAVQDQQESDGISVNEGGLREQLMYLLDNGHAPDALYEILTANEAGEE